MSIVAFGSGSGGGELTPAGAEAVVEFIDAATGERVGPPSRIAGLSSFTRRRGRIADDDLFLFPVGAPAVSITTDPAE